MRRLRLLALSSLALWSPARADDAPRGLVMSHATEAHRRLPCTDCHARAEASLHAADDLTPDETVCVRCHAAQTRPAEPASSTCGTCHTALGKAGVPLALPPAPRPSLHFSHRDHLLRGVECKACHAEVGGEPTLPTMERCQQCHRAQQASSCRQCHVAEPTGKLRTALDGRVLRPRGPLMGMAHDADWIVRHRWVGADRGQVCAACHEERECIRCHDGRLKPSTVHPGDYLARHAQDARRRTTTCQSCHATQTFCGECHSRIGLSAFAPRELRTGSSVHPPATVWSRGPNRHAAEARRNLSSCTTCHAERDCTDCHAAGATGGRGVSPHPPGYARRCAPEIAANSRACRRCHGDTAELRRRCQ